MKKFDAARHSSLKLSAQQRDLLRRRTMPFLDTVGIDHPLPFLLEEAYLQGMRDTIQAMTHSAGGRTP